MVSFQINNEIELRHHTEESATEIFDAVKANYKHLRTFLHWVVPEYSLESAKEFIAQSQKNIAENESEGFGIFYQNKFIGAIGFVKFDWNSKSTEIGYWIHKDFEGRGIITKACQVLINYAFDELEMNRIEIRCAAENVRSRAIPERFNFKLEGVLRQSQWRHTRFYDIAVYGILAEEWRTFNI